MLVTIVIGRGQSMVDLQRRRQGRKRQQDRHQRKWHDLGKPPEGHGVRETMVHSGRLYHSHSGVVNSSLLDMRES
jgi:hypothetical protein